MPLLSRSASSTNGNGAHPPRRVRATVTAAAKRITARAGPGARAQLAGLPASLPWFPVAWDCFDGVPEVKHAVRYSGDAMSKLHLFAAVRVDPDREPVPVDDPEAGVPPELAASAMAELARLSSGAGGMPELQRSLSMNFEVVGLAWLIGRAAREAGFDPRTQRLLPAQPERWEIRSESEVELSVEPSADGERVVCTVRDAPGAAGVKLDNELDTFTPIWQRHPRWSSWPDCHLRAALRDCQALEMLTAQVLAEAASAVPAEILVLPDSLHFARAGEVERDPEDVEPVDDPDADAAADDDPRDGLDDALDEHLSAAIDDPAAMEAVRHLVLRGPKEDIKSEYVYTLPLRRTHADVDVDKRIETRVQRIARGLNLPVEVVMGHQATTFANAEQVDEDTFEDYLEPRCELLVDALTHAFLRPNMRDAFGRTDDGEEVGVPAAVAEQIDRIIVWYDPSRIRASADTNANADAALDRFAISLAAYRKAKGFGEDDEPDVTETLVMAGLRRGILTAELTRALLELLGQPLEVEALPESAPPAEQAAARQRARMSRLLEGLELMEAHARSRDTTARELPTAARSATTRRRADRARTNPGARLAGIDRDLRTRLLAAADTAVGRALELAGNRLSGMRGEHRATVRNVAPHLRMALLGPQVVTSITGADPGDLLAGAFDELERQFLTWGAGAQEEALEVAGRIVGGFTLDERRALQVRQADDLAEAWRWTDRQLRALAEARMFTPDPAAPDLGEFDPTLRVPTGLVRQAVARAGGAASITTDGTSAFVTLIDNGTRPAGGIGTGELVRGVLRDAGVVVEAYRWVYGPARRRPFPPHEDLDGVVFDNFDDPVLANTDGFPPVAFYMPGDHAGCVCDFEPVLVTPDELDE